MKTYFIKMITVLICVPLFGYASTLQSLHLESNATHLNVGDTVTLSVVGTYSDNSTKTLTSNIEYLINPSQSVRLSANTLEVLKDGSVTVQATVGGVKSNTINLDIIWVVNAHTLPPEPDPAVNNATLLGVDVNDNGVRDDVERWIYDRYKNSHEIMIPLRMQTSRAYQKIIVDPSKAWDTYHIMDNQMNCAWVFTSLSANYFGRKPLVIIELEDEIKEWKEMKNIQYNTTQRARAYGRYNQTLSGGVFSNDIDDGWVDDCDFNTTKYIEMSEKL